jgi:hypothetical protein
MWAGEWMVVLWQWMSGVRKQKMWLSIFSNSVTTFCQRNKWKSLPHSNISSWQRPAGGRETECIAKLGDRIMETSYLKRVEPRTAWCCSFLSGKFPFMRFAMGSNSWRSHLKSVQNVSSAFPMNMQTSDGIFACIFPLRHTERLHRCVPTVKCMVPITNDPRSNPSKCCLNFLSKREHPENNDTLLLEVWSEIPTHIKVQR